VLFFVAIAQLDVMAVAFKDIVERLHGIIHGRGSCRLTTKFSSGGGRVSYTSGKAYMPPPSAAAPGSAGLQARQPDFPPSCPGTAGANDHAGVLA
jgi:hypothetical protein